MGMLSKEFGLGKQLDRGKRPHELWTNVIMDQYDYGLIKWIDVIMNQCDYGPM